MRWRCGASWGGEAGEVGACGKEEEKTRIWLIPQLRAGLMELEKGSRRAELPDAALRH